MAIIYPPPFEIPIAGHRCRAKNDFCNISVGDLRFNLALTTSRRQARLMTRPRPIASMKERSTKGIHPRSPLRLTH